MLRSFLTIVTVVGLAAWSAANEPPVSHSDVDLETWAYAPRSKPAIPKVKHAGRVRNPIDAFIEAKLEGAKIEPVAEADKRTLLRRATFDLTGLPPTIEQIEQFMSDRSPDAYEKLIDRLLASPRYGERWARHWLDLVRYADTNGFKTDANRPHAFRYRDYVIRSLNEDKPYDRFVMEQIAGDELFPGDDNALIATGFYRHYPDEDNARNLPQRRQEILDDITDTFAATFVGLTFACARCHDHKYDPILQEDYYKLQAFFAGFKPADVPVKTAELTGEALARKREWEAKTAEARQKIRDMEEKANLSRRESKLTVFPLEVREAVLLEPEKRSPLQQQLALMVAPQIEMNAGDLAKAMAKNKEWREAMSTMEKYEDLKVDDSSTAMAYLDIGPTLPATFLLRNGNFSNPGDEVEPGFPSAITTEEPSLDSPSSGATSGRRSTLARWLVERDNPLTARVIVNRLWHHHFGRGIVINPSDFGIQGQGPTHPELLDWLAEQMIDRGWSLKEMHRLMMTSSVYRRADDFAADAYSKDPENKLLWRRARRRIEAEAVRDTMLTVVGTLNTRMYGPGVYPPLPEELAATKEWPVTKDLAEQSRRSIYVTQRRNLKYPLLDVFDVGDMNIPCAVRNVTTTAPQALVLINGRLVLEFAQQMAARLLAESGADTQKMIDRAYLLCFARSAEAGDLELAKQFLAEQAKLIEARNVAADKLALPTGYKPGDKLSASQAAALVDFCHALLNSNELVYVD